MARSVWRAIELPRFRLLEQQKQRNELANGVFIIDAKIKGFDWVCLASGARPVLMLQRSFENLSSGQPRDATLIAADRAISLGEIFRILRRRSMVVAGTIVVTVGLAAAIIAFVPPRYTATSTILIDPHRSKVAEEQVTPPSNQSGQDTSVVDSEVLLVQSNAVLRRVVESLKLSDDPEFGPHPSLYNRIAGLLNFGPHPTPSNQNPQDVATEKTVDTLQRKMKVKRRETTSVIEINATSLSPEKAANVANAVADSYINDQVKGKYEANKIAAAWFNQRLDDLKTRGQTLQNSLVQLQASGNSQNSQVRLRELVSELDANRKLYEALLGRYKQAAAHEGLDLADSRIVARAGIPIAPSFPRPLLTLALAVLVGSCIGVLFAIITDYLDHRIKTMRQAEEIANVPALAALPLVQTRELAIRARRGRKALRRHDPKDAAVLPAIMQPPLMRYVLDKPTSLFAEAIRSVRLAAQRGIHGDPVKLVVVSSPIDGEGKTTLAVNLALSLAAIGMKTILVDGDLRNPKVTRSLCPQAKFGLVEVACGHVPFEQAVLIDRPSGLAVIPSPPRNETFTNEFVFTDAMSNFLQDLRQRYDFIIVDSPPLTPLVDARALAQRADGIVLAIRWDATPQDVVLHAIETLGPTVERMLGTVLTRVDLRRLRFYDYYRSSSYIEPYAHLGPAG
jgi:capsular exopolysaccharide synthesis family protein